MVPYAYKNTYLTSLFNLWYPILRQTGQNHSFLLGGRQCSLAYLLFSHIWIFFIWKYIGNNFVHRYYNLINDPTQADIHLWETKEDVKMNNKWFCLWACPCLYLCVRFPGTLFNVLFISDLLPFFIAMNPFPYARPFSYRCSSIFTPFIYFHLLISYFQQWLYLFIF